MMYYDQIIYNNDPNKILKKSIHVMLHVYTFQIQVIVSIIQSGNRIMVYLNLTCPLI